MFGVFPLQCVKTHYCGLLPRNPSGAMLMSSVERNTVSMSMPFAYAPSLHRLTLWGTSLVRQTIVGRSAKLALVC